MIDLIWIFTQETLFSNIIPRLTILDICKLRITCKLFHSFPFTRGQIKNLLDKYCKRLTGKYYKRIFHYYIESYNIDIRDIGRVVYKCQDFSDVLKRVIFHLDNQFWGIKIYPKISTALNIWQKLSIEYEIYTVSITRYAQNYMVSYQCFKRGCKTICQHVLPIEKIEEIVIISLFHRSKIELLTRFDEQESIITN